MPLGPIFLSASVPDPKRDQRYFKTGNTIAIRDAVVALVSTVLPKTTLVFGGHPAITPMVKWVADRSRLFDRVRLFQSRLFRDRYIGDIDAFKYIEVDAVGDSREESLLAMRRAMLRSGPPVAAAFFIGGMDGVEQEYEAVQELPYEVPCYPVATTGAAAAILWSRLEAEGAGSRDPFFQELGTKTAYAAVFAAILEDLERRGDPEPA